MMLYIFCVCVRACVRACMHSFMPCMVVSVHGMCCVCQKHCILAEGSDIPQISLCLSLCVSHWRRRRFQGSNLHQYIVGDNLSPLNVAFLKIEAILEKKRVELQF